MNFAKNIIEDDEIRKIYKDNFKERFNLNLNSNNSQIADTVVFMLISNNSYGEFTRRFLDNRNSLNLRTLKFSTTLVNSRADVTRLIKEQENPLNNHL